MKFSSIGKTMKMPVSMWPSTIRMLTIFCPAPIFTSVRCRALDNSRSGSHLRGLVKMLSSTVCLINFQSSGEKPKLGVAPFPALDGCRGSGMANAMLSNGSTVEIWRDFASACEASLARSLEAAVDSLVVALAFWSFEVSSRFFQLA